MIVYLITNTANNKTYVGKTVGSLEYRWKCHCQSAKRGGALSLQRAIRKYGVASFTVEVLAHTDTPEQLDKMERIWIILMNSISNGYNRTTGGDGGWTPSTETKNKLRRETKKQWRNNRSGMLKRLTTAKIRRRHSENAKQQWQGASREKMLKSIRSPEAISKFRRATKRLWQDPAYRKKQKEIRATAEYKRKRDEGLRQISPEVHKRRGLLLRGRKLSFEHRQKISQATKGKTKSEETRKRMSIGWRKRPPISNITRRRMSDAAIDRLPYRSRNAKGKFV